MLSSQAQPIEEKANNQSAIISQHFRFVQAFINKDLAARATPLFNQKKLTEVTQEILQIADPVEARSQTTDLFNILSLMLITINDSIIPDSYYNVTTFKSNSEEFQNLLKEYFIPESIQNVSAAINCLTIEGIQNKARVRIFGRLDKLIGLFQAQVDLLENVAATENLSDPVQSSLTSEHIELGAANEVVRHEDLAASNSTKLKNYVKKNIINNFIIQHDDSGPQDEQKHYEAMRFIGVFFLNFTNELTNGLISRAILKTPLPEYTVVNYTFRRLADKDDSKYYLQFLDNDQEDELKQLSILVNCLDIPKINDDFHTLLSGEDALKSLTQLHLAAWDFIRAFEVALYKIDQFKFKLISQEIIAERLKAHSTFKFPPAGSLTENNNSALSSEILNVIKENCGKSLAEYFNFKLINTKIDAIETHSQTINLYRELQVAALFVVKLIDRQNSENAVDLTGIDVEATLGISPITQLPEIIINSGNGFQQYLITTYLDMNLLAELIEANSDYTAIKEKAYENIAHINRFLNYNSHVELDLEENYVLQHMRFLHTYIINDMQSYPEAILFDTAHIIKDTELMRYAPREDFNNTTISFLSMLKVALTRIIKELFPDNLPKKYETIAVSIVGKPIEDFIVNYFNDNIKEAFNLDVVYDTMQRKKAMMKILKRLFNLVEVVSYQIDRLYNNLPTYGIQSQELSSSDEKSSIANGGLKDLAENDSKIMDSSTKEMEILTSIQTLIPPENSVFLDYTTKNAGEIIITKKMLRALIENKTSYSNNHAENIIHYFTKENEPVAFDIHVLYYSAFKTRVIAEFFQLDYINKVLMNHNPASVENLLDEIIQASMFLMNIINQISGGLIQKYIVNPPFHMMRQIDSKILLNLTGDGDGTVKSMEITIAEPVNGYEAWQKKAFENLLKRDAINSYLTQILTVNPSTTSFLGVLVKYYLELINLVSQTTLLFAPIGVTTFPNNDIAIFINEKEIQKRIDKIRKHIEGKKLRDMLAPASKKIVNQPALITTSAARADEKKENKNKQNSTSTIPKLTAIVIPIEKKMKKLRALQASVLRTFELLTQSINQVQKDYRKLINNGHRRQKSWIDLGDQIYEQIRLPHEKIEQSLNEWEAVDNNLFETYELSLNAISKEIEQLKNAVNAAQKSLAEITEELTKVIRQQEIEAETIRLAYQEAIQAFELVDVLITELKSNYNRLLKFITINNITLDEFENEQDNYKKLFSNRDNLQHEISKCKQTINRKLINLIVDTTSNLKSSVRQLDSNYKNAQFQAVKLKNIKSAQQEREAAKKHKEEKKKAEYSRAAPQPALTSPVSVSPSPQLVSIQHSAPNPYGSQEYKLNSLFEASSPLRIQYIDQACRHLIFIRKILENHDLKYITAETAHYALLYNIFRCFQSLKMYQQCGGSKKTIDSAEVNDLRNMIIHHGARYIDAHNVIEFARKIKGEFPQTLIEITRKHLVTFELNNDVRKDLIVEFGLIDSKNFNFLQLNPAALVLDNTNLYQSLAEFHHSRSENKDWPVLKFIPGIDNILKTVFTDNTIISSHLNERAAFVETFLFEIHAIRMLITICGETGEEYRNSITNPTINSFLDMCHVIRNRVGHAMHDLNSYDSCISFIIKIKKTLPSSYPQTSALFQPATMATGVPGPMDEKNERKCV